MSDHLPAPVASNTFERIKRVNQAGAEFWSARELARVLAYREFRNLSAAITKAREAAPGTIRGDFAMSQQYNLIHASESKEAAEKEQNLLFKESEIFSPFKTILSKYLIFLSV